MYFNPQAPCGARPITRRVPPDATGISIHRPLAGPDAADSGSSYDVRIISIHRPLAGPDIQLDFPYQPLPISIHRPLAGPDYKIRFPCRFYAISIHRPLAGPDGCEISYSFDIDDFNPQAPCGARPVAPGHNSYFELFQSTGPLRGPTLFDASANTHDLNFNPQAPCGARPGTMRNASNKLLISIHRPLAGPDTVMIGSTMLCPHFNPQAPCGARLLHIPSGRWQSSFQSTGPLRGPTKWELDQSTPNPISIHRPLAGPDARSGL